MRNMKAISMLLALVMLIPSCKAQDEATETEQVESTTETVMTVDPSNEATEPSEGSTEQTAEVTDSTAEPTEPSEAPTEPVEDPEPEPEETVTLVGTYDSVEDAFADYPKRYVTYSNNQPVEDNYDVVCKGIQNDYTIEEQYIGFIFSDLEDMGFLVYVHNNCGSSIQIQLMQVYAYNTVYQVNGWVDLYGLYLLFGGNSIVVGDDVIAFACNQNQLPILFYDGGYMCPKDDEQYSDQLFYFTEENGEIKYDWEPFVFASLAGSGLGSWLEFVIDEGFTGEYVVRHSGTVVLENGELYLREDETMALNDWLWVCPHKDYVMNCFGGLQNMTFDEIIDLYQEIGWNELREYSDSLKEQEGK